MTTAKRITSRTRINENWIPGSTEKSFASDHGISIETEWSAFIDYHTGVGSLMASWPAAWRTWCRNAAKYSKTRKPEPPLIDKADPFGAIAWVHQQRDVVMDAVNGKIVPTLGGQDAAWTARDVCEAAGFSPDTRPDLGPVGDWLRAEIDPDLIIEAIRTATSRPARPVLRYYDRRVREYRR